MSNTKRPRQVECSVCGKPVKVADHGPIPKFCSKCKLLSLSDRASLRRTYLETAKAQQAAAQMRIAEEPAQPARSNCYSLSEEVDKRLKLYVEKHNSHVPAQLLFTAEALVEAVISEWLKEMGY